MVSKNKIKLIAWNVNGLRAVGKKGLSEWLEEAQPDIFCIQESKAQIDQLSSDLILPNGFKHSEFNSAERKGYSGVASFSRESIAPKYISKGFDENKTSEIKFKFKKFDIDSFNTEGRVLETHHSINGLDFVLFNIYFPNGKASDERLDYKLEFYDFFLEYLKLYQDQHVLICGDYNTAHHPIDLARPKDNEKVSGFMPIERKRLDQLEELGFIDTFRHFHQGKADHYTWWSLRTAARKRNVGWRIDYFYASKSLIPYLTDAYILAEVEGSDHCPIAIEMHGNN